jgi:membrane-bound ClpP family serine protease
MGRSLNALVAKMESFAKLYGRNEAQNSKVHHSNNNLDPDKALGFHVIEAIASTTSEDGKSQHIV